MKKGLVNKKSKKAGIAVTLVTAVFAILGIVFLVIGYHDEVLRWMATTGIALLVVALIPIGALVYTLIQRKIDS